MIYYFCPDMGIRSGGIARLYRHVRILNRHGIKAAVLHKTPGFIVPSEAHDPPPVNYTQTLILGGNDIAVIPEGSPEILKKLENNSVRKFVIALNWHYALKNMITYKTWQEFGVEGILVVSDVIGEIMARVTGLPVHRLKFEIDHARYYYEPELKKWRIVYISRKGSDVAVLRRTLELINPSYTKNIEWKGLSHLDVDSYSREVRQASMFLSLSRREGLPASMLEAMASGTLVVGYDGVGGREFLVGDGPEQNAIIVSGDDYTTIARSLDPLFCDLIEGREERWRPLINRGIDTAAPFTSEFEEQSVVAFWSRKLSI